MNAVRSIVRALRVNSRAVELRTGITLAQLFVLQQLAENPAESLNDLAERTATHQSSVSVVVRRLVDRGLVARLPIASDKRRIRIEITPAGSNMLRAVPHTVLSDLIDGARRLDPAQRNMLAELHDQWLRVSGIDSSRPPMMFEDEPAERAS